MKKTHKAMGICLGITVGIIFAIILVKGVSVVSTSMSRDAELDSKQVEACSDKYQDYTMLSEDEETSHKYVQTADPNKSYIEQGIRPIHNGIACTDAYVYDDMDESSELLDNYPAGAMLIFRNTDNPEWVEIEVWILDDKTRQAIQHSGYIRSSSIEDICNLDLCTHEIDSEGHVW